MRELLLILIVGLACLGTFAVPQIGVLAYVWFNLMRPDVLAWSTIQFGLVLGVFSLISSARYIAQVPILFMNPISFGLIALQCPILLSVVFAVNPTLTFVPYNKLIKVVITALLMPLVFNSFAWFRRLILVMAFSIGFVALKFGVWAVLHGGVHVRHGFGGFFADSNGLALAMVMAFPLCWYCAFVVKQRWARLMFMGMAGGAVTTVIMTGSRGNAIAAAVIVIMLIWRSRYKVTALVGVALLIWPAAYVAGDRFYNRMSTLQDVEADGSARSRITFAKAAIEMALKYPIFGVGYGELNYARLHGLFGGETGYVAHNTYLQTAADSGFPALGIYIALLWGTIWWLGRSAKRMMRAMPEYRYYPYALQGSLLAFAIASTFYSRFDFEFLYFDLMAAAVWYRVERELLAAHDIKAVDDRSIKPFIPAPVAIATTEPQKAAVRQLHPGKPPR